MWSDDFVENVLAYMAVDSAQGVIEEVYIHIGIHGTSQTYTLFLTTAQIDALQRQ